jgi:hypothetical protein
MSVNVFLGNFENPAQEEVIKQKNICHRNEGIVFLRN